MGNLAREGARDVPSLLESVTIISPEYQTPYHQADWCEQIEACLVGGVRALNSKPIRHHKTQTTIHGIAWLLLKDPSIRIIYMVADHEIANDRANIIRQTCETAAVTFGIDIGPERGQNVKTSWTNAYGGGVIAMSAKQSKLGQDVDVLIFDDPLSEHDAFDKKVRDAVDRAIVHYTARAGRTERRGSVLGIMSRWDPDDPIGRRIGRTAVEWDVKHAAAIILNEDGEERAFAPEVMPLEELHRRRAELKETDPSERLWYAQFQNDPLPDALGLFRSPDRYERLPETPHRTVYGLDLAYSDGQYADFFALVVLKIFEESFVEDGRWVTGQRGYVVAAWRERWDPTMIESTCKMAARMYPGGVFFTYVSGPEIGTVRHLVEKGLPIHPMTARYGKRIRSQKTIEKNNSGRIVLPTSAPWVPGMAQRMVLFTGADNGDDDDIDALVSAVDGGMMGVPGVPRALGGRRI